MEPEEKTNLYKFFVKFSIIVCIFLFPIVSTMINNTGVYPENEASSSSIPIEVANSIAIFVWPILIVYIIMFGALIKSKINYRRKYYPLALITISIILFNLAVIYWSYMALWLVLAAFYPLALIYILAAIVGKKIDNKTLSPSNIIAIATVIFVAVIIAISPIIAPYMAKLFPEETDTETMFPKVPDTETVPPSQNKEETVTENINSSQNKYEAAKERIISEFNNLLDTNVIYVADITIPTSCMNIEDCLDTITIFRLTIKTENVPEDILDFCTIVIDSYKNIRDLLNKYNYTNTAVHFDFTDGNPFAEANSTAYKDGGYIREAGEQYLIYLNPKPLVLAEVPDDNT